MKLYGMEQYSIVQNRIELYRRKWCKIIQNHGIVSELFHRIEENLSMKYKIQEREQMKIFKCIIEFENNKKVK